jgi:hypothetical protein
MWQHLEKPNRTGFKREGAWLDNPDPGGDPRTRLHGGKGVSSRWLRAFKLCGQFSLAQVPQAVLC